MFAVLIALTLVISAYIASAYLKRHHIDYTLETRFFKLTLKTNKKKGDEYIDH